MKTEILARVADLIRNPEAPMRVDAHEEMQQESKAAAVAADLSSLEKPDTLTLSSVAQKLIEEADTPKDSQWEQARMERVQRVKELVQTRQYGFVDEVVDQVAQKIVGLLP